MSVYGYLEQLDVHSTQSILLPLHHGSQAYQHNCHVYTPMHQSRLVPTQTKLEKLTPKLTRKQTNISRGKYAGIKFNEPENYSLFIYGDELRDKIWNGVFGLRFQKKNTAW